MPAPVRIMPRKKPEQAAPAAVPDRPSLEAATRLADQGKLGEAAALCRQHIALRGPSAAAHNLLGVICDAGGDPAGAHMHYRKALYLDPGPGEALAHLAALLAMQGDAAGAARLAERARRAQAGSVA